jgi:hypothetical protein
MTLCDFSDPATLPSTGSFLSDPKHSLRLKLHAPHKCEASGTLMILDTRVLMVFPGWSGLSCCSRWAESGLAVSYVMYICDRSLV